MASKNWLAGLLVTVFAISSLLLAITFSMNAVFGGPHKLKDSLSDSGLYPALATNIVDNVVADNQENLQLPLDNPKVRQAADKAVSETDIQKLAESSIDEIYLWLEGESQNPNFSLNLNVVSGQIASEVSAAGRRHVQGLPVCTLVQLQRFDPATTDPFSWPCRPSGLSPAEFQDQYAAQINQAISQAQSDQKKQANEAGSGSSSLTDSNAPKIFRLVQILPWVLAVTTILSGLGAVLLRTPKTKSVKLLAIILIISGGLLIAGQLVMSSVFDWLGSRVGQADSATIQDAVLEAVTSISQAFSNQAMTWGITYIAVGVIGLIGLLLSKRLGQSSKSKSPENDPLTNQNSDPQSDNNKTPQETLIKPSVERK